MSEPTKPCRYFQPHAGTLVMCECGFREAGACDCCEVMTLSMASCNEDALADVKLYGWEIATDDTLWCQACVGAPCFDAVVEEADHA